MRNIDRAYLNVIDKETRKLPGPVAQSYRENFGLAETFFFGMQEAED